MPSAFASGCRGIDLGPLGEEKQRVCNLCGTLAQRMGAKVNKFPNSMAC